MQRAEMRVKTRGDFLQRQPAADRPAAAATATAAATAGILHSPRLVAQREQLRRSVGAPVQRMAVLLKAQVGAGDFIELTSIDYAVKRAGGPVAAFPNADFSTLGVNDSLYIVGHGAPGQAGDFTTAQIVARLLDPVFGLRNPIHEIVFTSCYAGKGTTAANDDDSVVSGLRQGLAAHFLGIPIRGARGPSGKSHQVGDRFTVVDDAITVNVPTAGAKVAWKVVQAILKTHYKPDQAAQDAIGRLQAPTPEQRADAAAEASGVFFRAWQQAMRAPASSPILNSLRLQETNFTEAELATLSAHGWVAMARPMTAAELSAIIADLQGHGTLTLAIPMTQVTT